MNQVPNCKNCGAPLGAATGQSIATCSYCGANNHLALPEPARPAGPVPYTPASSARPSRTSLAIVSILILIGVATAYVVVRISLGGAVGTGVGTGITLGSNTLAGALLEWYTPTCLVDANGDGALDVAGLSGVPGSERWKLRVVDGSTGSVLWSENDYKPMNGIVCLSPNFFGVEEDDFRLRIFAAKALTSPSTIPLSDHIDKLGLGEGCVLIKTRDGSQQTASLSDKPVAECNAPALGNVWGDWGIKARDTEDGLERTSGGTTYLLTHRSPGTPFLTLTARAQKRELWARNLSAIKPNAGLAFALTPSMLVVYGVDPKDDDFGVVIGVDPQTGMERYVARQDSTSSAAFRSFHFNGKLVLVDWGFGLHAYDPADGQRVWHIGGR